MSTLPRPVRYFLASLVGAVAVPAAAVVFELGAIMLLIGLVAIISSILGLAFPPAGAELQIVIEIIVVLLSAGVLVGAIEITRLLTSRSLRPAFYRRALITGLSGVGAVLPVVGLVAYVTLHSRMEPGLPLPLIVTAVTLHVIAGLIAWPVWLLHPELKSAPAVDLAVAPSKAATSAPAPPS